MRDIRIVNSEFFFFGTIFRNIGNTLRNMAVPRVSESSMAESLADLELECATLLQQVLNLGDFRPGSITTSIHRFSKPTCDCAQPNDRGHDPKFRLSRKENGKTIEPLAEFR